MSDHGNHLIRGGIEKPPLEYLQYPAVSLYFEPLVPPPILIRDQRTGHVQFYT